MNRDLIEKIKDTALIEEIVGESVKLRRAGVNLQGLCPFHNEKSPSLIVSPNRQSFKCFGCGKGGDVVSFVQERDGLTFPEAAKKVGARYGIEVKETSTPEEQQAFDRRTQLQAVLKSAQQVFEAKNEKAKTYWMGRGFTEDTLTEFGIGYADDKTLEQLQVAVDLKLATGLLSEGGRAFFRNRFMLPITDSSGNIVSFAGRAVADGDTPKYLNTAATELYDKSKTLFNLAHARRFIREKGEVLITEGYADVMMLWQLGYRNTVAVSGTTLTEGHISELKRINGGDKNFLRITLIFNGDSAGEKATLRSIPMLLKAGFSVKIAILTDGKDICDLHTEGGAIKVVEVFDALKDAVQYIFEKSWREDLTGVEFGELTDKMATLLSSVKNDHARQRYTDTYAVALNLDATKFRRQVAGIAIEQRATTHTEGGATNPDGTKSKLKEDETFNVGDFPLSVFHPKLQQIVHDCHKYLSYPKDFTAAGILAAANIAIGRRVRAMHVWEQGALVYMALVAAPGTNKSHPLSFAIHPIRKWDEREFKDYKKEFEAFVSDSSNQRPTLKKIIHGDFTIESLGQHLDSNRRGISVVNDELRGFFKSFGRYSGGGGEQEKWLENWTEDPLNITRSGRSIYIKRPSINIIGTTQPSVLDELGKDGRAVTGFVERFLYVIPEDVPILMLKKRKDRSGVEFSHMAARYTPIITRLLEIDAPEPTDAGDETECHTLFFAENADDILTEYINKLKTKMGEYEDEYKRNIFSKMQNYAIRFALTLELLNWAAENNEFQKLEDIMISAESVHHAITLCQYFLTNAMKANSMINFSSPVDKLPKNYRDFYRLLPDEFNTGEAEDVAVKKDISRANFYRFLKKEELFSKLRGGRYQKLHY
jgi:DNA primase catalytic core